MLYKRTLVIIVTFAMLTAGMSYKSFCANTSPDKKVRKIEIAMLTDGNYENAAEEAELICKKRISLDPSDYVAITQLGQLYWEKRKRKAAIKLCKKAIGIAPGYPAAHLFLGKAYFFEKKPEKGIEEFNAFKEKMDLLPEMDENTIDFYVSGLHQICYIYSTQKLYKEVLAECRKITGLRPDDQKAHYNMAVCYYVNYHNRSRAYNELQRVIKIDPHTRIADMAKYYIDYIRRNPDSRIIGDFGFLEEE